jgi:hypothetical protein
MQKIFLFGDSIAYGAWDPEGGWVERLRQWLFVTTRDEYNLGTFLYNLSIVGDTTTDLLKRFTTEIEARQKRSTPMEPNKRLELIDTLLEEAAQKIAVLEHATAAQAMSQEAGQNRQSMRPPQAHSAVQAEQQSWEKIVRGLTEVRTVLAQIEESERQRGVST